MSVLLFANNAVSTLAGAITSGATTANLAAGTGSLFPTITAGTYFKLTFTDAATGLVNEIVHVTGLSGDVITSMVRAQEGTAAAAWSAGDKARNLWTAGSAAAMLQQAQDQFQSANYAVDTGLVNSVVIALSPAPSSLASMIGAPVRFKKVSITNTGAVTLNLNSLGVANIRHADGSAIVAGELTGSGLFEVIFDGTSFILQTVPYQVPTVASVTAAQNTANTALTDATNALAELASSTYAYASSNDNWVRLTNGVIEQTINAACYSNGTGLYTTYVTLPITFPSGIFDAICSYEGNSPPQNISISVQPWSNNQVAVTTNSTGVGGTAFNGVVIRARGI